MEHWIIALCSEETAIKHLKLKNPSLVQKIDPQQKISTLGLAVILKKEKVKQYLLENHFASKNLLEKKFSDFSEVDQHLLERHLPMFIKKCVVF